MKNLQLENPLDGNLKPIKDSDGTSSCIELSKDKVKVKDIDCSQLSISGGDAITSVYDEDDMASDSSTGLATQQSIKAYVDASGGTNSIAFSTTFRARIQYNNWYTWNYSYGYNYYYWYETTGSTSLPSTYADSYVAGHIIPYAGNIVGYSFIGNVTSLDTMEFAIMKGNLAGGFGSAGDWTLSQIGSTQSAGGAANIMYKWGQDVGSFTGVPVVAGDMIVPYFRRTTDNDGSYSYAEISYTILMELS